MPAGELVTTPVPVPAFVTERIAEPTLNVAVTVSLTLRVTVHVPSPEQPPCQPPNRDPIAGVANSVTRVLAGNTALHSLGQFSPAGVLVTVPRPVPPRVSINNGPKVPVAV